MGDHGSDVFAAKVLALLNSDSVAFKTINRVDERFSFLIREFLKLYSNGFVAAFSFFSFLIREILKFLSTGFVAVFSFFPDPARKLFFRPLLFAEKSLKCTNVD